MCLIASLLASIAPGLLAALDPEAILQWTGVIFVVALGLGAVIFVHELGHFLVAKACGVKCEKFFIGFDIGGYKISRRGGETEYGIGILPLGGYVKMLGQDDDPSHIAEQLEKSRVDGTGAGAVEVTGPKGEKYLVDPRSYLAKSVPQRMAIISAGVIMNVIFAFIFAVVAYGMGVPYMPSIASETVPGTPAWRAGIEPGDEIVKLGDRENPSFMQLRGGVTLGNLEEGILCVVRRAEGGSLDEIVLTPERGRGLATIGIISPRSLTLAEKMPAEKDSPAATARLVPTADADSAGAAANERTADEDTADEGTTDQEAAIAGAGDEPADKKSPPRDKLASGDRIVAVDGRPLPTYRELAAELARNVSNPITIQVERRGGSQPAAPADARSDDDGPELLSFEIAPRPLRRLGLVMKMGPVAAVQIDSPAAQAGIRPGDVIETVNGRPLRGTDGSDDEGWDPLTLPDELRLAAEAGEEVTLTVARPIAENGHSPAPDSGDETSESSDEPPAVERVTIVLRPRLPRMIHTGLPPSSPLAADAAGIAYRIESTVHAVLPDTPAAATDVRPGDKIAAVKFNVPKMSDDESEIVDRGPVRLGPDEAAWPMVFDALQRVPAETEIELTLDRLSEAGAAPRDPPSFWARWFGWLGGGEAGPAPVVVKMKPGTADGIYNPNRGFNFEPIERIRKAETFGEQLRLGKDETTSALTMVFRFLQKIGSQVPITALGGPVTIARAAGYSAFEGIPSLLIFLTMLSANLAVINFLPIPLLDGGHMVFLAYEGIRGRPASEKFVIAMHTAGFVFIVSLMLFVLGLDFGLIPRNL